MSGACPLVCERGGPRLISCLQIAVTDRQAGADLRDSLAASDRDVPLTATANGMLMARQP